MDQDQIITWALSKGWWFNRYGNLTKMWNDRTYRLKLGKKKVRYEVYTTYDLSGGAIERKWVRLSSGFYKDLSISEDGRLIGLKMKV